MFLPFLPSENYQELRKNGNPFYHIKEFEMWKNNLSTYLMSEVANIKNLNHPNIIKIVDVCFGEYTHLHINIHVITENIERDKSILNRAKISYQLCSAVSYLHKNQILHCDIKPDNMIVSNGNLILIDFDISKSQSTCDNLGPRATLSYRPPETFIHGIYNYESEVWSVGCVIYEIYRDEKLFPFGIESIRKISKLDHDTFYELYNLEFRNTKHINLDINYKISNQINDLLKRIFVFNYNYRITIDEMLKLPVFNIYDPIEATVNIPYYFPKIESGEKHDEILLTGLKLGMDPETIIMVLILYNQLNDTYQDDELIPNLYLIASTYTCDYDFNIGKIRNLEIEIIKSIDFNIHFLSPITVVKSLLNTNYINQDEIKLKITCTLLVLQYFPQYDLTETFITDNIGELIQAAVSLISNSTVENNIFLNNLDRKFHGYVREYIVRSK